MNHAIWINPSILSYSLFAGPIPCDVCGLPVMPNAMARHKEHHINKEWKHKCQFCSLGFSSDLSLSHHMVTHNTWSCKCGKTFLGKKFHTSNGTQVKSRTYLQHLTETCSAHPDITKNLPFECQHCQKRMGTKRALEIHMGRWHADHYYSCDKCGIQHANKNLHVRHVGRCFGPPGTKLAPTCNVCGKTFTSQQNLTLHEARKICARYNEPKAKCTRCHERFIDQTSLEKHISDGVCSPDGLLSLLA